MPHQFRYPVITGISEKEQLAQLKSYLHQLVQELNYSLDDIDKVQIQYIKSPAKNESSKKEDEKGTQAIFDTLKPLIIKSEEIVNAYYEEISKRLDGEYVMQSDFDAFSEQTVQDIYKISNNITQILDDIKSIETEVSYAQNDIQAITEDIEAINTDIDSIADDLADMEDNVGEIKNSVNKTDRLTLGEVITASSEEPIDLNDLKTPGNYYSPNADNSRYIYNSPYTEGGFSLTVRNIQGENIVRQEIYYDSATWARHWNTEEWSEWSCHLMTDEPSSNAQDYVTEIGIRNIDDNDLDKGYWQYRKWNSGAVDMHGTFQITPVMESITETAAIPCSAEIQIDLPFAVEGFQFTGTPESDYFLLTNASVVEDNKIAFRLLRFTDFSDISVHVQIIANGRYKQQSTQEDK